MNLITRAIQSGEEVRLDINSDGDVLNTYYIDIKEAGRLREELTTALQQYDIYMAERGEAANRFMETG